MLEGNLGTIGQNEEKLLTYLVKISLFLTDFVIINSYVEYPK